MEITKVDVKKIEKEESRLRGYGTIVIDDAIAIHDIRIIDGDNGLFIAMPSRKTSEGSYKDIVHPINGEVRKQFEEAIFNQFNETE